MSTHTRPSSSTSTSIRSPGPYGGSPERKSRLKSDRRSFLDTPNSWVSSSTLVPGCFTRYGTTSSRRCRRADDLDSTPPPLSFGVKRRLQPSDDLVAELWRSDRRGVGAEREHPGGEALRRPPRDGDLHPPVVAGSFHASARHAADGPPGHVGGERDRGLPGRFSGPPRTRLHV